MDFVELGTCQYKVSLKTLIITQRFADPKAQESASVEILAAQICKKLEGESYLNTFPVCTLEWK